MTSTQPACDLHGISRRFGNQWALRGVWLSVQPGEVVGITGPNGSGKSTLLRVVSTALRATLGTGNVFGHDLTKEAGLVRSICGFLAHSPGNYDDLTARENLWFAAAMAALDPGGIDDILGRVGLAKVAEQRVRGFSAGMQRRLALGRLLLCRPRLLLLDEPFNNFDAAGVVLLNDVIDETRRRGGAALVVLHDRRQAEGLLDREIALAYGATVRPTAGAGEAAPVLEVRSA